MRVAFLGTSDFAATVLRRLAASARPPVLVVTPPDRPRGRGRQVASPPVTDCARELGVELLQTENVNLPDATERVRAAADVAVVCAFGQLIGDRLLSELEMLNVHPSLVPRWRGAAPIERAIMAGDTTTGVSIMRVTAGLDSGPVALAERIPISDSDDYGSLAGRLATLSGDLAVAALEGWDGGGLEFTDQDESAVTYAEKVRPEERRLDPRRPAAELERKVRALSPHIGAYLELEGDDRLGVAAAAATPDAAPGGELSAVPGGLRLGCAEGSLVIERVKPPGGRSMPADAYLRGHPAPSVAA